MRAFASVLLFFAIALAGCAEVRWSRPGGDDAELARDLSACRKEAQDRYGTAGAPLASPQLDPRFGPTGPTPAEARMQQAEGVGKCMRGKGYDLVPVK